MPRTILVVDDDPHIRQLVVFALEKAGLDTLEAANGEAALASVASFEPDLVVVDINMPRLDGLEVCRRLRASGNGPPVLFLSSRDDEIDRIVGIELGADDYVVKPFSPREVTARVQAILRRVSANPPPAPLQVLRHGRLTLDTDGWRAEWAGEEVGLTVTEFSILRTLASMPARVFSRDMIIDRLHGPGFAVTDRTIDSHVRNLRAKFAAVGGTDVVETRAGIGYRLGDCLGDSGV